MNLEADNLHTRINNSNECVVEPQYIQFLRENGYRVDEIESIRCVPSESDKGRAYLVIEIQMYRKPHDHPELDVVEDKITLSVCSCWSYRQNSADVSKGKPPAGMCKHVEAAFMTEKAKNDEQQQTL